MAAVREVAFELEAFEWSEERLDVVGRWKGLTGRRLARPVLTVQLDSGRRKRVVAMPGGQLGVPGESWHASFNWPGDPAEIIGAELELGRNVVVALPLPDRRRRRRRRHAPPDQSSVTEELRLEAGALRAQVDRLRAELAGRERELLAAREEIAAKPVTDQPTVELGRIEAERAAAAAAHGEDVALHAAHDEALEALRAEHAREVERLRAEHDAQRTHWQEEIDALREAFAAAAEEAEETRRRHAAELAALRGEAAGRGRAPAPPAPGPSETGDVAPPPTAPMAVAATPTPPQPAAAADDEEAEAAPDRAQAPHRQLLERLSGLFAATNGHHASRAGQREDTAEPPVLRATRSASAARARAGASVAARRSPAEVWALRGLAAVVVLVLLITFLLLITSLA